MYYGKGIVGILFAGLAFTLMPEIEAVPEFTASIKSRIDKLIEASPHRETNKDILFLFKEKQSPIQRVIAEVFDENSSEYKTLAQNYIIIQLELDREKGDISSIPFLLAEKFGILGTPSIYLADSQLQPYAHFLGGLKNEVKKEEWVAQLIALKESKSHRDHSIELSKNKNGEEKQKLLFDALHSVPEEVRPGCYPEIFRSILSQSSPSQEIVKLRQTWEEYLNSQAMFTITTEWSSPRVATKETVQGMLDKVNNFLSKDDITGEMRSYILVNYRFPLLVKKSVYSAEKKGKGIFSAESDRLMREALLDLNEVIKISPTSPAGKEALRLRTEISSERRKLP